jgi:hypothetical protein
LVRRVETQDAESIIALEVIALPHAEFPTTVLHVVKALRESPGQRLQVFY